ncbi:putative alternative thymidylate synthase [Treponema sp. JC4]|uniref:FAD-dependent thymidylate synthase n=1 Tax=Treponema sp. JC4 TaxID=1124982 RepID=UPI00025AFB20|nr:FAD-dependent thymidylate synthase [Treponema sp. JC4]EID86083.1 putative alternative thymidylate synthase [Treponema sp. JC4]
MITIIEKRTEKDPLAHIGENAGVCWNSDITDVEKNIKRGKSCIQSGHLRTAEYPTVEMIIEGYSARCIRELYTHIIGVTRLQDSTRYINFEDFAYYNPGSTEEQKEQIAKTMGDISENYGKLLELGMKKEDCANILPLGMHTKIVWKINLRGLIHFMNMRLCNRALKEIRTLAGEIKTKLSAYSEEWKWICDNYFVPTCKSIGYCTEEKCCGLMPKGLDGLKEKIIEEYKQNNK